GEHDAPRSRQREVDIPCRPPEPQRRRSDAHSDRAVRAVRTAVRVGAWNELSRHHQTLLGEIEMDDAVPRRCVVRLLEAMKARECAPDVRLSFEIGRAY